MLTSTNFMSKHWNYFFYVAQWMNFAEQTMTAPSSNVKDVLNIAQNSNSITVHDLVGPCIYCKNMLKMMLVL